MNKGRSSGRICKKKRNTDHGFPPHYMWMENNKKTNPTPIHLKPRMEKFGHRTETFGRSGQN